MWGAHVNVSACGCITIIRDYEFGRRTWDWLEGEEGVGVIQVQCSSCVKDIYELTYYMHHANHITCTKNYSCGGRKLLHVVEVRIFPYYVFKVNSSR